MYKYIYISSQGLFSTLISNRKCYEINLLRTLEMRRKSLIPIDGSLQFVMLYLPLFALVCSITNIPHYLLLSFQSFVSFFCNLRHRWFV